MGLQERITALAQAIGEDIKAALSALGAKLDISAARAYVSDNTASLTYTYAGVLDAPPVALAAPGMLLASPTGKERAYGVLFSSANLRLTAIEFTKLELIGGSFTPNNMAALTSLSLPALTAVGGSFNPTSMGALTSLSLPALTTVGGSFTPNNMAALTSLSLPALTTVVSSFNITNMGALTSLSLPALTTVGSSFNITSAALNQASVDGILVRLAALDGTAGTTAFSNRTVTITGTSSAPSAVGLAAKATLVSRGCTVTHK